MPIYDCAARFLQKAGFAHAITNGDELLLGELSKMAGDPVTFSHSDNPLLENGDAVVISDLPTPDTPTDCIEQAQQIVALLSSTHAKVVIFCQEENLYSFFNGKNQEIFRYLRPLTLRTGTTEKQIYVYTKEKSIMETAEKFHCEKELPYTGVTVKMDGISASEAEKIRLLEGVLAATEKRLNSYIAERKKAVL